MTWIRIHFFPVRIRIKIKWILSTAMSVISSAPPAQLTTVPLKP